MKAPVEAAPHLDALGAARRLHGALGGPLLRRAGQQDAAHGLGLGLLGLDKHAVAHGGHGLDLRRQRCGRGLGGSQQPRASTIPLLLACH